MDHSSWWTQAPEPTDKKKTKPREDKNEYKESAASGFYAGPSKKRSSGDVFFGSTFAAFEHPFDVVSNTVQYSFTV